MQRVWIPAQELALGAVAGALQPVALLLVSPASKPQEAGVTARIGRASPLENTNLLLGWAAVWIKSCLAGGMWYGPAEMQLQEVRVLVIKAAETLFLAPCRLKQIISPRTVAYIKVTFSFTVLMWP